jgi:hypothetical protein
LSALLDLGDVLAGGELRGQRVLPRRHLGVELGERLIGERTERVPDLRRAVDDLLPHVLGRLRGLFRRRLPGLDQRGSSLLDDRRRSLQQPLDDPFGVGVADLFAVLVDQRLEFGRLQPGFDLVL